MSILAVNAGSSSIKFAVYPRSAMGEVAEALLSGLIEGLEPGGRPMIKLKDRRADNASTDRAIEVASGEDAFSKSLALLHVLVARSLDGAPLEAVTHRVVHGGARFKEAVIVTETVMSELEALSSLAPLHQPHNLEGIRRFQAFYPDVIQVACFDTAFHATLPEEEYLFALPKRLSASGIRRYGFHGLSYDYLRHRLRRLSARSEGRVVMAHLGSGASLCAMKAGQSVATTMGFSALDGLMMGTRSGALDPGVVLHLLSQGMDARSIEHVLYKESGLLGVSGEAADMRTLRQSGSDDAQRAIRLFTYRVRRELGALIGILGGLDALVFTGGIGEHDAILRAEVVAGLEYLDVRLNATANDRACGDEIQALQADHSSAEVWVIPTDEGRMAAQAASDILARASII